MLIDRYSSTHAIDNLRQRIRNPQSAVCLSERVREPWQCARSHDCTVRKYFHVIVVALQAGGRVRAGLRG